jgi:DNA-binding NarL/FixJ family response regulator
MGSNPGPIRILAADDHPLLLEGITALIKGEPNMELVAEASDGEQAIEQFRTHRPDVTLMDLRMPNLDGIEAISRIRKEFPDARIIVLSTYSGDVQVLRAIKVGARGYVVKGYAHRELLDAIRLVHNGQKRIPYEIATKLAQHAADDELSSREMDVVRLIATGNANKDIADKLAIAETTVKSHIRSILSKLGVNDRTHAVTVGLQRGILELASF